MIIVQVLLGVFAVLGVAGYIRSALDDFGGRAAMPSLLIGVVLALGFLGLTLK